ncbi:hypothetical protein DL765_002083 [Monosporascus sp. GIB2]|nr:hypothetical protein DL765_002083 [Monosporascus sp. GIB2]
MGARSSNVSGETGNLQVLPSTKYLAAIVSLVGTASAIDLFLRTNNDRGGGNALRCNGINPNICCGADASNSPFQSVAVRGIPGGRNLQCRSYDGGRYKRPQTIWAITATSVFVTAPTDSATPASATTLSAGDGLSLVWGPNVKGRTPWSWVIAPNTT